MFFFKTVVLRSRTKRNIYDIYVYSNLFINSKICFFSMTTETTSPEWEDIMKIDKKITALGFGMACILWRYIFTYLLISDLDSIQKIFFRQLVLRYSSSKYFQIWMEGTRS